MPFFLVGIVLVIAGAYLHRMGKKKHNHDFELGSMGLIVGGVILILLYGLFYRGLALLGL